MCRPAVNVILTNSGFHDFDSRRTIPLGAGHAESVLGTNAMALKLAAARFKERWPQIQLDYDPVLLSPTNPSCRASAISPAPAARVLT